MKKDNNLGNLRRLNSYERQAVTEILRPFGYFYEGNGSIGTAEIEGKEQKVLYIDYVCQGGACGNDKAIGERLKKSFKVDTVIRGVKLA